MRALQRTLDRELPKGRRSSTIPADPPGLAARPPIAKDAGVDRRERDLQAWLDYSDATDLL